MAEPEKPKLVEWNLRGFPEELRAACQKIALDERSDKGKRPRDADVVARLLRQALGLPRPLETEVQSSTYKSGPKKRRLDSKPNLRRSK
jgi:hypothetical protein